MNNKICFAFSISKEITEVEKIMINGQIDDKNIIEIHLKDFLNIIQDKLKKNDK